MRAISSSNLAKRVSALPLLPASCPALISFISKEGRDFLWPNFFWAFQEKLMELLGSLAGTSSWWDWLACARTEWYTKLSSLEREGLFFWRGKSSFGFFGLCTLGAAEAAGICLETTMLSTWFLIGDWGQGCIWQSVTCLSVLHNKNQFLRHFIGSTEFGAAVGFSKRVCVFGGGVCVYVCVSVCECVYACMWVCMHVCVGDMCMCLCVHVYVYMFVYGCEFVWIYLYKHVWNIYMCLCI